MVSCVSGLMVPQQTSLRTCAFLLNVHFVTGSRVTATWNSLAATTIAWMRTSREETIT